jgi:hypothetical protein
MISVLSTPLKLNSFSFKWSNPNKNLHKKAAKKLIPISRKANRISRNPKSKIPTNPLQQNNKISKTYKIYQTFWISSHCRLRNLKLKSTGVVRRLWRKKMKWKSSRKFFQQISLINDFMCFIRMIDSVNLILN